MTKSGRVMINSNAASVSSIVGLLVILRIHSSNATSVSIRDEYHDASDNTQLSGSKSAMARFGPDVFCILKCYCICISISICIYKL